MTAALDYAAREAEVIIRAHDADKHGNCVGCAADEGPLVRYPCVVRLIGEGVAERLDRKRAQLDARNTNLPAPSGDGAVITE